MPRDYDRSSIPSVYNLQTITPYRSEPGFEQVVFRGIDQMIGFSRIGPEKPDGEPHTHPYEQSNMLVEGRLDFLVDGERIEFEPYDALTIPPEVPHTSRAVEGETATLLAFWPLREDRLDGTEYQQEFPEP
ncbi:cupin domain-containing protein [Halalkalicoccus subterraneus]|uniref:cupin domain-containing protein n=1 Tax=Halalkalicoccus subterraneus TaxID=2675002 RepID=UPI000EFBCDC2|nr:cupin domain-containing protein [Halalkalicoccus subterraneus]